MENASVNRDNPEELFSRFSDAEEASEILQTFQRLLDVLGIHGRTDDSKAIACYHSLKSKLQSWKCKSLWELLDTRVNLKEYGKGKTCEDLQVIVIGAGPIGLRTAIEAALLGAHVVVVEKRTAFSRNNVLHLWPFLLTDFRSLGAKKFYGKFCSGSIDHISIRKLQAILLKIALIFGANVYMGVTFEGLVEPANEKEGWKCKVSPKSHAVNQFEVDVVIGADGKKNVLPGFAQIEMRGTLAIGITVNFVNHYTEDEKMAEEISGIAYQFNPSFFDTLYNQLGIKLENIVYYKDETHYFVMTASKASLLKRGALKEDLGNPAQLLAPNNVNQSKLTDYAVDAVRYATKGRLRNLEVKRNVKNKPDIAAFDFTSIKKAEHAARIVERKGSKLLVGLVGDSLLQPFWPTGSGCARGVLSALDAAWMIRSFSMDKPPLQIIGERENIYRLLSGTSDENLHKNHAAYTLNPTTRYKNITTKKIREVYHLYDTDDPVNADFSLGSPVGHAAHKASKKKKVVVTKASKRTRRTSRHRASDSGSGRLRSFSGSSGDLYTDPFTEEVPLDLPLNKSSRGRTLKSPANDKASDQNRKTRKAILSSSSTQEIPSPRERSSTSESIKGTKKSKRKGAKKSLSPGNSLEANQSKATKKRGLFRPSFGLGRSKTKSISGKENKPTKAKGSATKESAAKPRRDEALPGSGRGNSPRGPFTRNEPTRRSAKDLIRDIEARAQAKGDVILKKETGDDVKAVSQRSIFSKKSLTTGALGKDAVKQDHVKLMGVKRVNAVEDPKLTPVKLKKRENILEQIAKMSPMCRRALPVLTKLSPEANKENEGELEHSVMTAARNAALVSMVLPLLIDDFKLGGCLARNKSLILRGGERGRVRDVVNRYNTMGDSERGDETPKGWRKTDRTDGPDTISQNSDTLDNFGPEFRGPPDGQEGTEDRNSAVTMETEPSVDDKGRALQESPAAVVTGKSLVSRDGTPSSPSLERLRTKLRGLIVPSKLPDESANENDERKVNLASPIYQKTLIVAAVQERKEKDEKNTEDEREKMKDKEEEEEKAVRTSSNKAEGGKDKLAKPVEKRRGTSLTPSELMDDILETLASTWKPERTLSSLKYMIGMFRAIELHPHNEKYRRVFKGRVKFRKYVGTVRSARTFMQTSGWVEIGSFLLFPLSKEVGEPLRILRKYLRIVNKEEGGDEKPEAYREIVEDQTNVTPRRSEPKRQHSDDIVSTVKEVKLTVDGEQNVAEKSSEIETQTETSNAIIGERLIKLLEHGCEDNDETVCDLTMENPLVDNTKRQSVPNAESSNPKLEKGAGNDKAMKPGDVLEKSAHQDVDNLAGTLDNLIDYLGDIEDTERDSDNEQMESESDQPELDALSRTLDVLMHGLSSEEEDVLVGADAPRLGSKGEGLAANIVTETSKEDSLKGGGSEGNELVGLVQKEETVHVGVEKGLNGQNEGASSWKSKEDASSADLSLQNSQRNALAIKGDEMREISCITADEERRKTERRQGLSDSSRRVISEENVFIETESDSRQKMIKREKPQRDRLQSTDDQNTRTDAIEAKSLSCGDGKVVDIAIKHRPLQSSSAEDAGGVPVVEKRPVMPSTSKRRPELIKAKSLSELSRIDMSTRIMEAGKRARMRNALMKSRSMNFDTINRNGVSAAMGRPSRTTGAPGASKLSSAASGLENAVSDEMLASTVARLDAETFSKTTSLDDLSRKGVEMSLESERERPERTGSVELIAKMKAQSEAKTKKTALPKDSTHGRTKRREEIATKLELLDAVLGSQPSLSEQIVETSKPASGHADAESRSVDSTLVESARERQLSWTKPDSEIFKVPEIPIKRTTRKAGRTQRGSASDKGLSSGSEDEKSQSSTSREESNTQPRRTRASAVRERASKSSDGLSSRSDSEKRRPSTTIRRSRSSISGERSRNSSASLSSRSDSEIGEKRLRESTIGNTSGTRRSRPCVVSSASLRTRRARPTVSEDQNGAFSTSEDERKTSRVNARTARLSAFRDGAGASSASEDEKKVEKNLRARPSASRGKTRALSASEDEKKADKSFLAGRTRSTAAREGTRASSASEDNQKVEKNVRTGRARLSTSRGKNWVSSASEDEKKADKSFRAGRTRSSVSREGTRDSSASEDEKKADTYRRAGRSRPSTSREVTRASSASEDDLKLTRAAGNSRVVKTNGLMGRNRSSSRSLRPSSSDEEGNRCNGSLYNKKMENRRIRPSISTESEGENKPPRRSAARTGSSSLKTRSSVRAQNSMSSLSNQSGSENEKNSAKANPTDIRRTRAPASSENLTNRSASEDEHRSTANSTDRRTRPRVYGKRTTSSASLSSHSASEDDRKPSRRTRESFSEKKLPASSSSQSVNEDDKKQPGRIRTRSDISGERPRAASLNVPRRDEDEMKRSKARPKVYNGVSTRSRVTRKSTSNDKVSVPHEEVKREDVTTSTANHIYHADKNANGVDGCEVVEKQATGNQESTIKSVDCASENERDYQCVRVEVREEVTCPVLDKETVEITGEEFLEGRTLDEVGVSDIPGNLAEVGSSDLPPIIEGIQLSKCDHEFVEDEIEKVDFSDTPSIRSTVSGDRSDIESLKETADGEGCGEKRHANGVHLETSAKNKPPTAQVTSEVLVERRNGGQRQSRKDVVSMTFEERKQLLVEAANAPPKTTKPANSRRSIMQIQNRNSGQLVTNTKEMYETIDTEPAAAKSSKNRYLGFLHWKNKGPRKAADTRRQLPDVHEVIDKNSISDRQHPLLSSAVSAPDIYLASTSPKAEAIEVDSLAGHSFLSLPRNSSGLRRKLPKSPKGVSSHVNGSITQESQDMVLYKSSPNLFEIGDDKGEQSFTKNSKNAVKDGRKSRSPISLSPLRLKLKKRSGSYDLQKMQAKKD